MDYSQVSLFFHIKNPFHFANPIIANNPKFICNINIIVTIIPMDLGLVPKRTPYGLGTSHTPIFFTGCVKSTFFVKLMVNLKSNFEKLRGAVRGLNPRSSTWEAIG